jgi:hypothetical protein
MFMCREVECGEQVCCISHVGFLVVTQNQADWAHRRGMLETRLAMQTDAPAVATTNQSTLGRICPVPADRLSLLDDRHHGLFTLVRRIAVFAEQSLHLAPPAARPIHAW